MAKSKNVTRNNMEKEGIDRNRTAIPVAIIGRR